jgi:hypothetical protein
MVICLCFHSTKHPIAQKPEKNRGKKNIQKNINRTLKERP